MELVVVFQLVAAFLHEIVETAPGLVAVGDAGEDGKLVVVPEILKFHAPHAAGPRPEPSYPSCMASMAVRTVYGENGSFAVFRAKRHMSYS